MFLVLHRKVGFIFTLEQNNYLWFLDSIHLNLYCNVFKYGAFIRQIWIKKRFILKWKRLLNQQIGEIYKFFLHIPSPQKIALYQYYFKMCMCSALTAIFTHLTFQKSLRKARQSFVTKYFQMLVNPYIYLNCL